MGHYLWGDSGLHSSAPPPDTDPGGDDDDGFLDGYLLRHMD